MLTFRRTLVLGLALFSIVPAEAAMVPVAVWAAAAVAVVAVVAALDRPDCALDDCLRHRARHRPLERV